MKTKNTCLIAGVLVAALLNGLAQPVISTQPQDQTNYVGTTATLTVVATGTQPVSYQWQKLSTGFANLADRTNAVLILTNVQTNDAADYRVVVTDAIGTTNSATAHLNVALPETLFVSQPAPGLVTLSWQGNMVLVQSRSLDCAAWVRVYGTSPLSVPIGADKRFFRLAALPPGGPSQSDLEECAAGDVSSCENYVAAFLINPERSGLPLAGLAASTGMALSGQDPQTSCVLSAQSEELSDLTQQGTGP